MAENDGDPRPAPQPTGICPTRRSIQDLEPFMLSNGRPSGRQSLNREDLLTLDARPTSTAPAAFSRSESPMFFRPPSKSRVSATEYEGT
jgi:hypothetical protein